MIYDILFTIQEYRMRGKPQSYYENINYKSPPNLPLPKGGSIPLFGKEG
jgi:hypothetical protein